MRGSATYLDHNATTPLAPEVLEAMLPYLKEQWGNASSIHRFGVEARYAVEKSRQRIAKAVGSGRSDQIVFTRGGTHSINLAIRGAARHARRKGMGNHLVTSAAEHHAVLETCLALRDLEGFELTILPVDEWARVRPDEVAAAVRSNTVLVSLMMANNEVGCRNPLEDCIANIRSHNASTLIHSDGVQAVGKLPLNLRELGVDLFSLGAHKINGPKGIGALYLGEGVEIEPIETGGGQESGIAPGTENVASIVGFAAAVERGVARLPEESARLVALREGFWNRIREIEPAAIRNSPVGASLPGTLNVSFPGISGPRLVDELDRLGFAVSAGSACSSRGTKLSHVLTAMTGDAERCAGALRISLGATTAEGDLEAFGPALRAALSELR